MNSATTTSNRKTSATANSGTLIYCIIKRVLLKPPTTDPLTHRPLSTYPPTHRPLTHRLIDLRHQLTLKQKTRL